MARRRRVDRVLRELRERKYRLRGGRGKSTKFIPASDRDFAHMARQFVSHIEREAARFPFSAEQIEQLHSAVKAYREALYRTIQPVTAGPRATFVKNEARAKAEKIVRSAAKVLRGIEESLTSADRLSLNLQARPARLKARTCPDIAPVLRFIEATKEGKHVLEYGNDFDRASSAKPHGAARLELFVELVPPQGLDGVGGVAGVRGVPTHPGQLSGGRLWYMRSFTTSRFEVEYPVLHDGTPALVVYWGRWADARGGVGPFSQTCVARVESGAAHLLPQQVHFGKRGLPAGMNRRIEAKPAPHVAPHVAPHMLSHILPAAETRLLSSGA